MVTKSRNCKKKNKKTCKRKTCRKKNRKKGTKKNRKKNRRITRKKGRKKKYKFGESGNDYEFDTVIDALNSESIHTNLIKKLHEIKQIKQAQTMMIQTSL